MNEINDGGPAFPQPAIYDPSRNQVNQASAYGCDTGLSLRDYFAAKAMQEFLHGSVLPPGFDASEAFAMVATRSYEVADSMLKARQS